jgi:hypothetical protein
VKNPVRFFPSPVTVAWEQSRTALPVTLGPFAMQSTTLPGAETTHFVPEASRVLPQISLAVLKCLVCGGHVKGSAAFFLLAILLTLPAAAAAVGTFEESSLMVALPEMLPLTCAFDGKGEA